VKLTWDQDDPKRANITRKQFTEAELDEYDFADLIAPASEESEDEDAEKYRKLLAGEEEDDHAQEEMEITFTPGLTEAAEGQLAKKKEEHVSYNQRAKSVHPDVLQDKENETTIEAYMRKQKEKKERKRLAREQAMQEKEQQQDEQDEDNEEEEERKQAELELIMMEEKDVAHDHFDLNDIMKKEKASKKKKSRKNKNLDEVEDDFSVDANDPRFAAIHESHVFAIDPTHPQ
jgi:hypothetical protein